MAVLPTGIGPVTGGYQIERSLRFNSADSAYLSRTPASASNRQKFTLSLWEKGGNPTANSLYLLSTGGTSTERFTYSIKGNGGQIDIVQVVGGVVKVDLVTTAVYRDPSAWYHFVLSVDTTQATPSFILYVNGVQATLTGTNSLAQNANTQVNNTNEHDIGKYFAGANYLNGYLTEINFIDGQALTPSSFGETDAATGVWKAKKYAGTYGTNGFYLNFADNSGTTSTTLGKDSSGNGNNWTPNNFSVTAGAGNDSLVDSPTAYGADTGAGNEVRGNYCTLNPLEAPSASVVSNGNLQVVLAATGTSVTPSTIGVSSGKWYAEFTFSATASGNAVAVGVGPAETYQPSIFSVGVNYFAFDGTKYVSGVNTAYGATWTTNDVIGIALDVDGGTVTFYKNNSSQGAITLPTSTSGWKFCLQNGGGSSTKTMIANFGQRAFAYTAPSGFKALVTTNLPTPTIGATSTTLAGNYFNPVLYTGNGSTQSITGVSFQPDFVWIKERSSTSSHALTDSVRGVSNLLSSNTTDAEATGQVALTAFNTNGFSVGADGKTNESSQTYVGWNWNAGGSNATNTSGSITSTVRANTTSGFSIVTWTGNNSSGSTVGHGLGVAPKMIIIKSRSRTTRWLVWTSSLSSQQVLVLNDTAAAATGSNGYVGTVGSSNFQISGISTNDDINFLNATYVAYCFAPVAGYSAFGRYTGNGSADGPFIYTGFRPRYVLVKNANDVQNWFILDTARSTFNLSQALMRPNTSDAEATGFGIDIISNGFKVRNNDPSYNANGNTIIYAAFAETPTKFSLAR